MDFTLFSNYSRKLQTLLMGLDFMPIYHLAQDLRNAWKEGRRVFICGNGGSAANALHFTNDLLCGISRPERHGLRAMALTADTSVLTCLANDLSYQDIFSKQLEVLGSPQDILIVLSGSGNSQNIIQAIMTAKNKGIKTFGILGYSGGACLKMLDVPIHYAVDDMQLAEDLQLITGHMIMQWLYANPIGDHRG